jgi:hypothetical protein
VHSALSGRRLHPSIGRPDTFPALRRSGAPRPRHGICVATEGAEGKCAPSSWLIYAIQPDFAQCVFFGSASWGVHLLNDAERTQTTRRPHSV